MEKSRVVSRQLLYRPIAYQFLFLLILSCTSISFYSEKAYEQATSLKVESLAVVDLATEDISDHQSEVGELKMKLLKAYEYAKGRPRNEISAAQWQKLIDPNRNLLGGFLKRWEEQSKLSKVFVEEAKALVSDAFDTIIDLESGKIRPKDLKKE